MIGGICFWRKKDKTSSDERFDPDIMENWSRFVRDDGERYNLVYNILRLIEHDKKYRGKGVKVYDDSTLPFMSFSEYLPSTNIDREGIDRQHLRNNWNILRDYCEEREGVEIGRFLHTQDLEEVKSLGKLVEKQYRMRI